MKKDIHPKFKEVVFKDVSTQFHIITHSTIKTKNTIELKGKTYPLMTFDVSSSSHPFYTGKQRLVDTEGRAEKFRKKYGRPAEAKNPKPKTPAPAPKPAVQAQSKPAKSAVQAQSKPAKSAVQAQSKPAKPAVQTQSKPAK